MSTDTETLISAWENLQTEKEKLKEREQALLSEIQANAEETEYQYRVLEGKTKRMKIKPKTNVTHTDKDRMKELVQSLPPELAQEMFSVDIREKRGTLEKWLEEGNEHRDVAEEMKKLRKKKISSSPQITLEQKD